MNILEISQIIFNFTASAAILVVGLLISIIAFEIITSINQAKKMANGFLAAFTAMPFLAKIFNNKKNKKHED